METSRNPGIGKNKTKQNKTKQNKTKQNKTKQNKTRIIGCMRLISGETEFFSFRLEGAPYALCLIGRKLRYTLCKLHCPSLPPISDALPTRLPTYTPSHQPDLLYLPSQCPIVTKLHTAPSFIPCTQRLLINHNSSILRSSLNHICESYCLKQHSITKPCTNFINKRYLLTCFDWRCSSRIPGFASDLSQTVAVT